MKTQLPIIKKTTKGFTLIELMIVIAIIAVLSIIGITIYNGQQLNARNNRRREDINAIANALETNKATGSSTYTQLYATMFSSGIVPLDPNNATVTYCGTAGAAQINAPTAGWNAACSASVPVNNPQSTWASVAQGTPASNSFWMVCASIEPYTTGGVYCRGSSQT